VLLKTAVEWQVIRDVPCSVRLLKVPRFQAAFHEFDVFETLVEAAGSTDRQACLVVLLGGEAGLRCGEMIALEWADVDLGKRQVCVRRSDWNGHVTAPKSGRLRHVPLTVRLTDALRAHRHLRSARVLCREDGSPLSRQVVQYYVKRAARRAQVRNDGVHVLRHHAERRIMPSRGPMGGRRSGGGERGTRHNQRASRKASRASAGR
jgi:integrase